MLRYKAHYIFKNNAVRKNCKTSDVGNSRYAKDTKNFSAGLKPDTFLSVKPRPSGRGASLELKVNAFYHKRCHVTLKHHLLLDASLRQFRGAAVVHRPE
jgi:hypothetical protein